MKKPFPLFFLLFHIFFGNGLKAQNLFNIKEINTNPGGGSFPNNFTVCNNKLYFFAADNSNIMSLWVTLGTDATTQKIFPALNLTNSIGNLICFNNKLFFTYDDGIHGNELWTSDGTAVGTSLFIDLIPGISNAIPKVLTICNNKLYFAALNNTGIYQLYVSDGTVAGTVLLKTVSTLSGQTEFAQLNNEIYFNSDDGTGSGFGFWKSNGTVGGTVLLKANIVSSAGILGYSTLLNSKLYFNASDNTNGSELWATDGTTLGTNIVINLRADPGGGSTASGNPQNMKVMNNIIYFAAEDDVHGMELFGSDGTAGGTYLVKDIVPGSSGSLPYQSTIYNGLLYLICSGSNELWKSDGTSVGTVLVKNFLPYGGRFSANWNNKIYFIFAADFSLWQSDGTTVGTTIIQLQNTAFPAKSYTDFPSDIKFIQYNSELYLDGQCFQIADGFEPCKLSVPGPLPLTWLGIKGQWVNNSQAKISWEVANQQNIKNYAVQKSTDGVSYITVYTVTATSQSKYSCLVNTNDNKNYFRVKETDNDERISYSSIAVLEKINQNIVHIFPNPVTDVLNINNLKNFTLYQVIDMSGKIIQEQTLLTNNISLNTNSLAKGNYLLKLFSNDDVQTIKFIKE